MKKRAFALILTVILILSLAAGCTKPTGKVVDEEGTQATAAPTPTAAVPSVPDSAQLTTGEPKGALQTKLHEYFTEMVNQEKFSGYVLIAQGDVILFSKGYAFADFEKKIPHSVDTKYGIASIGKQMIATAVMQQYEKGLIHVEDTLDKYLPGVPHSERITIHQMLTHTSGLPDNTDQYDLSKHCPLNATDQNGDKKENEKLLPLVFEPGTNYGYSSIAYSLLACVVEKVTNKPFDQYLVEDICKPLGMSATTFRRSKFGNYTDNVAEGYMTGPASKYESVRLSGIISSPKDMYLWSRALYSGILLKPETQELMHSSYDYNYGYGWNIIEGESGNKSFYHFGSTYGFKGYLYQSKSGFYIVMLSNVQSADVSGAARRVSEIFSEVANEQKED